VVIDAHVHLWDLGVRDQPWIPAGSPIRRTFTMDDLRAAVALTPMQRVVLVQVINDAAETADFLACSDDDLIAGVVGWADLSDPAFPDVLTELKATGPLIGVRHQALAEPNPAGWLTSTSARRAFAALERVGLPFDLVLRPEHLAAARAVARRHPSLCFVLDHLGKPPIAQSQLEPWAGSVRQLAAEPNVVCKLSGLQAMAGRRWTYRDLAPFIEVALEAFGPERLIYGSDWPVSTTVASYAQVLDAASRARAGLSPAERAAIMGGTAGTVYRLQH
jgi:L-fuconolactonase